MMRPYSQDLRERIIEAPEAHEGSQAEIAERFTVSLSFVRSCDSYNCLSCHGSENGRPLNFNQIAQGRLETGKALVSRRQ
jgi:hypothetical protein